MFDDDVDDEIVNKQNMGWNDKKDDDENR